MVCNWYYDCVMQHKPLAHEKAEELLRNTFMALRTDKPVRIPAERTLATRLGISRVTLRRALAALVAEGLLVQRQGNGTYVLPVSVETPQGIHLLRSPEIKFEDPFYMKFLTALAAYAATHNLPLTLLHPEDLGGKPDQGIPMPSSGNPLVVVGPIGEEQAEGLVRSYTQIVSIHGGGRLAREAEVRFDDRHLGSEAFILLQTRGFTRLALLAGPERYDSAAERRRGFLEAADAQGIPVHVMEEKMNWSGGVRAAESFLANQEHQPLPEAVFAANDWMALGFMQRLREAGVRIPEDISVLGCDNIPLASEFNPPLATFDLNMAHLVAEIAAQLFHTPRMVHGRRILLPATFLDRQSLGTVGHEPDKNIQGTERNRQGKRQDTHTEGGTDHGTSHS